MGSMETQENFQMPLKWALCLVARHTDSRQECGLARAASPSTWASHPGPQISLVLWVFPAWPSHCVAESRLPSLDQQPTPWSKEGSGEELKELQPGVGYRAHTTSLWLSPHVPVATGRGSSHGWWLSVHRYKWS